MSPAPASAYNRPNETSLSIPERYSAHAAKLSPIEIADRIASHILEKGVLPPGISSALPLESILAIYDVDKDKKYLDFVINSLKQYADSEKLDTFTSIGFCLFERTKNPKDMGPFIERAREDRKGVLRAFDGAVSFYRDEDAVLKEHGGDIHLEKSMAPIFIDHFAEYATRMAKAGWLTGEDDFYREAVQQILIFRGALRDPRTGLWAHGRGWYESARHVTDTKWGRGHAWLMRTFVETLTYLPRKSPEFAQISEILHSFSNTLLRYQDTQGFWRQVVDHPESYQETSATGLISYYYARAIRQGFLPREKFAEASRKAFDGLSRHRISSSGLVYGGVISNPPLRSVALYLSRETPVQDSHAVGAAILASAGQLLLKGKGDILPGPPPALGQLADAAFRG